MVRAEAARPVPDSRVRVPARATQELDERWAVPRSGDAPAPAAHCRVVQPAAARVNAR